MLGLDPEHAALGELAASAGRPLPLVISGFDAGAWIAWCLTGLPLFVGRLPSLRRVKASANRVAAILAMLQTEGNISAAAQVLGTSRRTLREGLRAFGLYPWLAGPDDEHADQSEPPNDAGPKTSSHAP